MCQCIICDCCWWNFCGDCCAGWAKNCCFFGCWSCKPPEMSNPACCSCCTCTGWGANFFCYGVIYCVPDYVKEYSRLKSGTTDVNVIVVNTATPMQNYWLYEPI